MRFYLIVLLVLFATVFAFSQTSVYFDGNFEDAVEAAGKTGK